MIQFVEPTKEDLKYLSQNLREEDMREVSSLIPNPDYLQVLRDCVEHSDTVYVVRVDEVPVVIFGSRKTEDTVERVGKKAADIWLLGTNDIKLNKTSFLKLSRKCVRELARDVDYLWNIVDPRNELHIRWLKWLGFTFPFIHPVREDLNFLVAVRNS